MLVTEDAELIDDYGDGTGRARVQISEEAHEYLSDADNYIFSTKSSYARHGFEADIRPFSSGSEVRALDQDDHIEITEGYIEAELCWRSVRDDVDVKIEEGDALGRFGGYQDSEVVRGDDLTDLVEGSPYDTIWGRDEAQLPIQDGYFAPTQEGRVPATELRDSEKTVLLEEVDAPDSFEAPGTHFFQTIDQEMPDDYYACLEGVSGLPSRHLNSRIIDPGFEGPIALEVQYQETLDHMPTAARFTFIEKTEVDG